MVRLWGLGFTEGTTETVNGDPDMWELPVMTTIVYAP